MKNAVEAPIAIVKQPAVSVRITVQTYNKEKKFYRTVPNSTIRIDLTDERYLKNVVMKLKDAMNDLARFEQ